MTTPNNFNVVQIDRSSSTAGQPYGIITADCSSPKEIDDGIFVETLDADQEMYRVGVCVADTSRLYGNKDVFRQVMARTEAKYLSLSGKEYGYEPMIDPELIRDLEFSAGNSRSALIVQFVIGADQPPTDVDVIFGRVQVLDNQNYRDFWLNCQNRPAYAKFARASGLIMRHLQYTSGRDADNDAAPADPESVEGRLSDLPAYGSWYQGSQINESFMVGAGHLVAKLMAEEGRPTIYRVHDPEDESHLMFLPPHIATFSWEPGPHHGLGLTPYTRVTSPLRRLEDFVMAGQLKKRHKGIALTIEDHRVVRSAVQQLNRRVASDILRGPLRMTDYDVLGSNGRALARSVFENAKLVPVPDETPGMASA